MKQKQKTQQSQACTQVRSNNSFRMKCKTNSERSSKFLPFPFICCACPAHSHYNNGPSSSYCSATREYKHSSGGYQKYQHGQFHSRLLKYHRFMITFTCDYFLFIFYNCYHNIREVEFISSLNNKWSKRKYTLGRIVNKPKQKRNGFKLIEHDLQLSQHIHVLKCFPESLLLKI